MAPAAVERPGARHRRNAFDAREKLPVPTLSGDCIAGLVRNHLGGIEDFRVALERTQDVDAAERMGEEFAEDFRLLRDIGWSEHDVRESYVLTMPVRERGTYSSGVKEEAASALIETGTEVQSSREDAETDWRLRIGVRSLRAVLGDLEAAACRCARIPDIGGSFLTLICRASTIRS